eukprot:GHVT01086811.1.p1 GENE.GHVT01086811.1~~GHVT01086811.1.p1  ORF type:complete len:194 (-),score=51.44 GHVT01086811.1:392-973(-)
MWSTRSSKCSTPISFRIAAMALAMEGMTGGWAVGACRPGGTAAPRLVAKAPGAAWPVALVGVLILEASCVFGTVLPALAWTAILLPNMPTAPVESFESPATLPSPAPAAVAASPPAARAPPLCEGNCVAPDGSASSPWPSRPGLGGSEASTDGSDDGPAVAESPAFLALALAGITGRSSGASMSSGLRDQPAG